MKCSSDFEHVGRLAHHNRHDECREGAIRLLKDLALRVMLRSAWRPAGQMQDTQWGATQQVPGALTRHTCRHTPAKCSCTAAKDEHAVTYSASSRSVLALYPIVQ